MAAPDDGDCFLTIRKKDLMVCPYDPVHRIKRSRLTYHLLKCKSNPQTMKMDLCPYDANHHIPVGGLVAHLQTCPLKLLADRQASARATNEQAASSNVDGAEEDGDEYNEEYYEDGEEYYDEAGGYAEGDYNPDQNGNEEAVAVAPNEPQINNNRTGADENWDDISSPANPTVPLVVSSQARQPLDATSKGGFYVDVKAKKPAAKKEIYLQLLDEFGRRNPGAVGCDSGTSTAATPVPKQAETESICGGGFACAKKVDDDGESVTPTPADFGGAKGPAWGPGWSSDPKTASGESAPRGVVTSRDPTPSVLGRGRGRGVAPKRAVPLAPAVESHIQSMMAENLRNLQKEAQATQAPSKPLNLLEDDFPVVTTARPRTRERETVEFDYRAFDSRPLIPLASVETQFSSSSIGGRGGSGKNDGGVSNATADLDPVSINRPLIPLAFAEQQFVNLSIGASGNNVNGMSNASGGLNPVSFNSVPPALMSPPQDRSIVSGFTGTSVISNDFSVVSTGGGVAEEPSPAKPKRLGGFGQAVLKSNLVSVNPSRCVSSVSHLGAERLVPVPSVVPVPVPVSVPAVVPGPIPVAGTQRLPETRSRPADAEPPPSAVLPQSVAVPLAASSGFIPLPGGDGALLQRSVQKQPGTPVYKPQAIKLSQPQNFDSPSPWAAQSDVHSIITQPAFPQPPSQSNVAPIHMIAANEPISPFLAALDRQDQRLALNHQQSAPLGLSASVSGTVYKPKVGFGRGKSAKNVQ